MVRSAAVSSACLAMAVAVLVSLFSAREPAVGAPTRGYEVPGSSEHLSAGGLHKLVVFADDLGALQRLESQGRVLRVIEYGAFKLVFVDDATLDILADPALRRVELRDYYDLVRLNRRTIDTRRAPGATLGVRRGEDTPEPALFLVQFVGPPRNDWRLELVRAGDVELVHYIPHNAYLVRATTAAARRLSAEAKRGETVQWIGSYEPTDKVSADVSGVGAPADDRRELVVQLLDVPPSRTTVEWLHGKSGSTVREVREIATPLHGLRNLYVDTEGAMVGQIAQSPDVVWIEPAGRFQAASERQAQIVAGNTRVSWSCSTDITQPCATPLDCAVQPSACEEREGPTAPGYWEWLSSRGLCPVGGCGASYDFVVDISDSGFAGGNVLAVPPDFAGRVSYIRDYTFDPAGAVDRLGHGTTTASALAGRNTSPEAGMQDEELFQYGLGIAPHARIGASKIFAGNGQPDRVKLLRDAHRSGAVISSNSWNSLLVNAYDAAAQEYDALVRDADDLTAGNQAMTVVFSMANRGPSDYSIRTPATAKNVIAVGSSEGFWNPPDQPSSWCKTDAWADDARDMTGDSSRGPTPDGRIKPDLVAPGTRIVGVAGSAICDSELGPHAPAPSCNQFRPCDLGFCCPSCELPGCGFIREPNADSRAYLAAAGTSFSAPAVAGAAALVRRYFQVNGWAVPSPAMTKAFLVASARFLTGTDANATDPHSTLNPARLPSHSQGYGRLDLGRAFDGTPGARLDEDPDPAPLPVQRLFTATGSDTFCNAFAVVDPAKPVRVVLAWTDAPGSLVGSPWQNNLDLEVKLNGVRYPGNHFGTNGLSRCMGSAGCGKFPGWDFKNNAEAVFLPEGTTGFYDVIVRAMNIVADAVPGNGIAPDQDFALVVYNGTPVQGCL